MKLSKFVLVSNIGFFISGLTFGIRPNGFSQLGLMIFGACLFCIIVISLIKTIFLIRRNGLRELVPIIFSIFIVISSLFFGHYIRLQIFRLNLNAYKSAVDWVRTQEVSPNKTYVNLSPPERFSNITYAIHASKTEKCGLVVWFFWGSGFPVRHTMRIFVEDTVQDIECLGRYYGIRQFENNWYEATG